MRTSIYVQRNVNKFHFQEWQVFCTKHKHTYPFRSENKRNHVTSNDSTKWLKAVCVSIKTASFAYLLEFSMSNIQQNWKEMAKKWWIDMILSGFSLSRALSLSSSWKMALPFAENEKKTNKLSARFWMNVQTNDTMLKSFEACAEWSSFHSIYSTHGISSVNRSACLA